MLLGSGPLGRAPTGAVQFNVAYVVQTIGRVTLYGTTKIRVKFRVTTLGQNTTFGSVATKRIIRAASISSQARFGPIVIYGWHDASQTYKNLNYWTTQGRIY